MNPNDVNPTDSSLDPVWMVTLISGGLAGTFFGFLAGLAYGQPAGAAGLGLASGLGVGWLWCRITIPRACKGDSAIGIGTLMGIAAGLASTLVVHAPFLLLKPRASFGVFVIGLFLGGITGLLAGALCGWFLRRRIRAARRWE